MSPDMEVVLARWPGAECRSFAFAQFAVTRKKPTAKWLMDSYPGRYAAVSEEVLAVGETEEQAWALAAAQVNM
jgi:hypothetical protein